MKNEKECNDQYTNSLGEKKEEKMKRRGRTEPGIKRSFKGENGFLK